MVSRELKIIQNIKSRVGQFKNINLVSPDTTPSSINYGKNIALNLFNVCTNNYGAYTNKE